jgi:ferredoxin/flavodoxin---NADP+ reductase
LKAEAANRGALIMTDWVAGRVIQMTHWTDKLFSLRVEAELAPYVAGQFTRLALELSDETTLEQQRVAHAYSFVNPPGVGYHEFYVVMIPEGRLTPHLQQLRVGDSLWLARQASGFLTLDELPAGRDLWMLATGTAIGPFLSLLAEGQVFERFERLVLAHGVRLGAELSYSSLMSELLTRWPGRLQFVPFVTREDWAEGIHGRIPDAIVDGRFEAHVGLRLEPATSQVMLCGNPAMVKETLQVLQARGLRKHLRREPGQISMENYW